MATRLVPEMPPPGTGPKPTTSSGAAPFRAGAGVACDLVAIRIRRALLHDASRFATEPGQDRSAA